MRFLYQYINPTGAKARASRNGFIGCRGPPSHSPCLPRPCPEPWLLWIVSRAPAEAQSEPASQSATSGCAGDSTKHLQPEQQPWISSRSQPPWTARLWEKKRTVTTGNGQQSRFFSGVLVLSEKVASAWDAQDTHYWRKYPRTGWL